MAVEDGEYSRIAPDFWRARQRNAEGYVDRPPERLRTYRTAFRELGLESGITMYADSTIVLERSSAGIVTSGSSVSFMRTQSPPSRVTRLNPSDDFSCELGEDGSCAVAKHLEDDWYIVLERN